VDLLILIATCAVNLILGLFVFVRDTKKSYTRLFATVSILLTVWIISNFITNHYSIDLNIANWANKIAFVSGFGVLLSAVLFTYNFPVKKRVSFYEVILVAVVSVAVILLSLTESVAGVVTIDSSGKLAFSIGELIGLWIIGFMSAIAIMARNLITISKKREGILKVRQSRFILFAFVTTALFGLLLNVIIPVLQQNWDSSRYGPLVTVILVMTIAYTIVKHGLFDIRLAVVRGVAYIFSLMTLAGVYYVVAYTISQSVSYGQGDLIGQSPFSIALALVLAFVFQPVKRFFDKITNGIFYRDNYDTDEFLARLGQALRISADLRNLLQRASAEIGSTIQSEFSYFFVRYGDNHHTNVGTLSSSHMGMKSIELLDAYIVKQGSSVIITELLAESEPLFGILRHHKIAIILPLMHGGRAPSYLFIGHRRSREFTDRDARALNTISNELVIAIQNALSVQEVKDINATLQQRIDEATKELRANNAQLQRLDEAKDDFLSMASHQLRTPLTSVKGYLSMVLEGDVGKITDTQKQLLGEAFTSSERMVHLINDFLNVSRLQTGKFMLESRPINLAKVVGQEVDSLQTTAEAHDMKLHYRMPSHFPILNIDESKIRQVVMNFIDNAIYYSKENSTITTSLETEDGYVVLKVQDTGIGVPESEQAHLFTKFFRATNARKQRPDGTGVGLFLSKKVIVAHGGSMLVESVEGEGSTFGFRLPIKKLSEVPANKPDELKK